LEVSDEEIQLEGYLKSLSPAEELAVFLSIRVMCLNEAKRNADAAKCLAARNKAKARASQSFIFPSLMNSGKV